MIDETNDNETGEAVGFVNGARVRRQLKPPTPPRPVG